MSASSRVGLIQSDIGSEVTLPNRQVGTLKPEYLEAHHLPAKDFPWLSGYVEGFNIECPLGEVSFLYPEEERHTLTHHKDERNSADEVWSFRYQVNDTLGVVVCVIRAEGLYFGHRHKATVNKNPDRVTRLKANKPLQYNEETFSRLALVHKELVLNHFVAIEPSIS